MLVFFRNQVLKVWPLVSNHRLCDGEWIQLSAGGAEIFNVKNLRISESSIACSHGCLIWVGSLSNLGRKVYFLPAQSWLPTYNIYLLFFFSSRWGTVCPCTLCELKVEYITKDLKHLALLHCLKKIQLVPEDIQDPFKTFINHWISENILCLLSWISRL